MGKLAKFKLIDRCKNISYLSVLAGDDSSVSYRLVSAGSTPLALSNIMKDQGALPGFMSDTVINQVEEVLKDSYVDIVSIEVNPMAVAQAEDSEISYLAKKEGIASILFELDVGVEVEVERMSEEVAHDLATQILDFLDLVPAHRKEIVSGDDE